MINFLLNIKRIEIYNLLVRYIGDSCGVALPTLFFVGEFGSVIYLILSLRLLFIYYFLKSKTASFGKKIEVTILVSSVLQISYY